ncbi:MAG: hypothetical protein COA50_16020 [Flavobacteriaceae bacterium]|nr:MAG: hypothetical protein COA50_16020 [Flavobacteriaceae bacterium]
MKIHKNIFWVPVFAILCIARLNSQVNQPSNQAQLSASDGLMNCGHILDGPAYYLKQLENKSLDNMLKITKEEKKQIGEVSYAQVHKKEKIITEFQNKRDILQTFANLKKAANGLVHFKLHVIDSEDINAFTMIGGHIYLTTGLLTYVDSMDELAFILGHEIGHHEKFHLERKIKKIMAASAFFGTAGIEDFTKIAVDLNNKFSAPFDQINEYEADAYGFELAKKTGYDINRFTDFFKRLEKTEKRSMLIKLNSTHPFSSDRRKCLENHIAN